MTGPSVTLVIGGMGEVRSQISGWATTVVSAVGPHVPRSAVPVSFAGARHLVLGFRDTTDQRDPAAFTESMARNLVAFGQAMGERAKERVVVHCVAGVGRSPALAYGLLVAAGYLPPVALEMVLHARPQAKPNALVVARCDDELDGPVWRTYEDWAQTMDWWGRPDMSRLSVSDRLEALRLVKVKQGPAGQSRPTRLKRSRRD